MKIAVIGSGYVGLVSGTCFAELGHHVTCVDNDESKIAGLLCGISPIFEPGLDVLICTNVEAGRLNFTTNLRSAVAEADAVFIAVGTPTKEGDGHADLSYIYAAAREIASSLTGFTMIVTKSTVPVGTGDEIESIVKSINANADVAIWSNPEFLKEGAAIADFMAPDRIVVGGNGHRGLEVLRKIYEPITRQGYRFIEMDRRGAELTKYAANAFLATKITFINEIANLCERVGTDIRHVAEGIGSDSRIGDKFLSPGPGYGGSCFPKDTLALIKTAQDFGAPQQIVESVARVNASRKKEVGERIVKLLGNPSGKKVALLGLTFKANTDDMRDSPALDIIDVLQAAGVEVRASDPEGVRHAAEMVDDLELFDDPYRAVEGVDATVVVTEWPQFKALDLKRIRNAMRGIIFADLRNLFSPDALDAAGFYNLGIGRPMRGSSHKLTGDKTHLSDSALFNNAQMRRTEKAEEVTI